VSAARARGTIMVKILNKCILSISMYNLFLDRERNILYTSQYFHTPVYWLPYEIEIQLFTKCSLGEKKVRHKLSLRAYELCYMIS